MQNPKDLQNQTPSPCIDRLTQYFPLCYPIDEMLKEELKAFMNTEELDTPLQYTLKKLLSKI